VRIGTAEIYQVVETFPYITDSLVVGQTVSDDVRIILFVVMDKDLVAPENLFEEIKSAIRERLTARHIPAKIIIAPEVPHTKSGKKVELAVTKILNGEIVENTEALVNPLSLEFFKNIEELQR
jgi:acetoacetyl-CoA synthetase